MSSSGAHRQRSPRTWLLGGLVALALLGALLLLVRSFVHREAPDGPRDFVPTTWLDAREAPLHAAHLAKGVTCDSCHTQGFTTQATDGGEAPDAGVPVAKVELSVCASCHATQSEHAHRGLGAHATTCLSCHQFYEPGPSCTSCHSRVLAPATMQAEADKVLLTQHASEGARCESCHTLHATPEQPRAQQQGCFECHAEVSARHGALEALATPDDAGAHGGEASMCASCHTAHQPAKAAAERCVGCHRDEPSAPKVHAQGPKIAGHEACTTCHQPHAAKASEVLACVGCHGNKSEAVHGGHQACASCHTPHTVRQAERSCASCHQLATLSADHVGAHAKCTSCHDPHRSQATAKSFANAACVTCHADVHPQHPRAKSGACTGCHTPHAPKNAKPSVANACTSCHKPPQPKLGDRAFHAPKRASGPSCTACHKSHDFPVQNKPALCNNCHRDQSANVRAGHAACDNCHGEPHEPIAKPSCTSCHAPQTHSAPRGHAQCTQCHDAHSGSLAKVQLPGSSAKPRGPDPIDCASCHRDKPKAQHGALSGGCISCHRAHGPKGLATPPSCASCHQQRPGLHGVKAHAARCESCHSAHQAPRADRATCTSSCHQDRRDHQPDAESCKGCHLFR